MSHRMNWLNSEYQDNSICPRRVPPTGHGINLVPRMQPQVPEVSMFVPSSQGNNGPFEGRTSTDPKFVSQHSEMGSKGRRNFPDHSLGSVRAPIDVEKHSHPLSSLKKTTSELSLMFHDTLDLSVTKVDYHEERHLPQGQGSVEPVSSTVERRGDGKYQDEPSFQPFEGPSYKISELKSLSDEAAKPPEMNAISHLPPDVTSLIRWQTQQILMLQKQVQELTELITRENPKVTIGRASENGSGSSQSVEVPAKHSEDVSSQKKSNLSVSLEMSKKSDRSREMCDLQSSFRQSPFDFETHKHQNDNCAPARATPLEELSFCSSLNALQGDIQCDRDVIPPDNIDEILFKETNSHDIGDRGSNQRFRHTFGCLQDVIQCDRDVIPPDNIHRIMSNDHTEIQGTSEDNCSTLARLREMGVSFVRKEDLLSVSRSSQPPLDSTMMFYPKAADSMATPSLVTSTSEYSLLLNSAALKYLNDAQLATVAKSSPKMHHNQQEKPRSIFSHAN